MERQRFSYENWVREQTGGNPEKIQALVAQMEETIETTDDIFNWVVANHRMAILRKISGI